MTARHLIVRQATPADRDRWNRYVDASNGRAFAYWEWSEILARAYGAEPCFLLAEDETGEIQGTVSGYCNRSGLRGRGLYSLRHGVIARDDTAAAMLLAEVQARAQRAAIGVVRLTSGTHRLEALGNCEIRTTVVLPLGAAEGDTWNALRRETRVGIKRSMGRGTEVEWGYHNLRAFYDIYVQNMIELRAPLHSYKFFAAIAESLPRATDLVVVRSEGKVIAGMVVFWSATTVDLVYGAWLREHAKLVPYQRMYWEAIRVAQEKGLKLVDMGESRPGSGTFTFKTNFGGEAVAVHYVPGDGRAPEPAAAAEGAERPPGMRKRIEDVFFRNAPRWGKRGLLTLQARNGRLI